MRKDEIHLLSNLKGTDWQETFSNCSGDRNCFFQIENTYIEKQKGTWWKDARLLCLPIPPKRYCNYEIDLPAIYFASLILNACLVSMLLKNIAIEKYNIIFSRARSCLSVLNELKSTKFSSDNTTTNKSRSIQVPFRRLHSKISEYMYLYFLL